MAWPVRSTVPDDVLSYAVAVVIGIDEAAGDPAELARRRGDLVPGRRPMVVARRRPVPVVARFQHFHDFALVQPDLDHVAGVVHTAAHPGRDPFVGHRGQAFAVELQVPAGDPGEAVFGRADGEPAARVVAIDFDLGPRLELFGRVIVFARPAADINIVGGDERLIGERLFRRRPRGCGIRGDTNKQCDKGPAHGDASQENGLDESLRAILYRKKPPAARADWRGKRGELSGRGKIISFRATKRPGFFRAKSGNISLSGWPVRGRGDGSPGRAETAAVLGMAQEAQPPGAPQARPVYHVQPWVQCGQDARCRSHV